MIKYLFIFLLTSCLHKPKNIIILGNSITVTPVDSSLRWYGNWGMAATCADSDYVHILMRKDTSYKIRFKSAKDFELNPTTFNFHTLDSFKNAGILIMRICENVKDEDNFLKNYSALITYLHPKRVIITGGFWKRNLNHRLQDFAVKNDFPFVKLSDLSTPDNEASDESNPGVAAHPNNKGMRLIADRIWFAIN